MVAMVVAYVATAPVRHAAANTTAAAATEPAPSTTTAALTVTTPTTTAVDPVVAVVGDSLAYSIGGLLDPALELAGFTVQTDLAPGRQVAARGLDGQISAGLEAIQTLKAADPVLWVVQLGTNDVMFEAATTARYAELVAAALDAIGPGPPVVWVNIWRADRPTESAMFDAVLRLIALQRPQLRVADWHAVAVREPVLAPDGVHLNDDGLRRFTQTIVDAAAVNVA
jgi:lysophospholipase L1-like esterase